MGRVITNPSQILNVSSVDVSCNELTRVLGNLSILKDYLLDLKKITGDNLAINGNNKFEKVIDDIIRRVDSVYDNIKAYRLKLKRDSRYIHDQEYASYQSYLRNQR